jgi:hypothetical protein
MPIPAANPFLAKNSPKIELMLLFFHRFVAYAGTVFLAPDRPAELFMNLCLRKPPVEVGLEMIH